MTKAEVVFFCLILTGVPRMHSCDVNVVVYAFRVTVALAV
jgi:hypothetical protein